MLSKNGIVTQLHQITPEQLTENIIEGVKKHLREFKKELDPKTPERFLSRTQTAKMLSISLTCLSDWSRRGILNPMKLGNRVYYKYSSIENKLNNSNNILRQS